MASQVKQVDRPDPNQAFYDKAIEALRDLFERAKAKHELHFAMALMPEMRGIQDGGWNTAEEAVRAFDEYETLLKTLKKDDPVRVRVTLAFYLHASECSGFYEIPKKLMLTIEEKGNNFMPFNSLVKKHTKTGQAIDPNANRIMKDLMGHAWLLGLHKLAEVLDEAFDGDVRNAIAHANYTLAEKGMRLRRRNGGQPRIIPWDEFDAIISRGLNVFSFIRQLSAQFAQSYDPPKTIKSRLNDDEPEQDYTIYYLPDTQAFGFVTGKEPPQQRHWPNKD